MKFLICITLKTPKNDGKTNEFWQTKDGRISIVDSIDLYEKSSLCVAKSLVKLIIFKSI